MISMENVSKKYKDFKAVDNLDIKIEDGNIVALVGPNGAGKSTTINMLIGTIDMTEGSININGLSVEENSIDIKKQIGYVSDDENKFLKLKAIEYLNFVADMYGISEEERKERILSLSVRFNIQNDLNTVMDKFSKGMKQKIMIISSLIHKPKVWILDEPFTGLDPTTSYELKTFMREYANKGNIVILSSHILEIVENLCDKVLLIKKGKTLYYGDMQELKEKYSSKHTLEEIYMEVFRDEKEVISFSRN
ncbi:ABC transporter ATP-binding protein [Clostridium sp. SHJSY1]|uniref:ABC transporter ATP-binding protein n=1 Tax=Clostridium sp. SHJSY1 TaxID=2942483 RepID=UPI002875783E|nr:ABC transporter ATP-binding protein [Clostridium sp. SHJSY1]MDS0527556.1 ABC transporter ATP-binding protein [Clostridium sp. SHJSY1]